MKKLFISMLAVAALASCAKEETLVADKGDLIGFNSFVENSTRATDPSYSANDIESFKVYGTVNDVLIYDGDVVSRPSTVAGQGYGSVWAMEDGTQQYWIAGAQYKFVGIVDGDKANVTTTTLVDGMPTSIDYTADGKTDLLCQTVSRKDDFSTVAFNFTHLLSKVNFTVVNGSTGATGYSFVVKNITFNGATKATYDVENAKWLDATTTGNKALAQIAVATGATSAELATEVLFLPGKYTISFTVDILYDGELVTTTNYPATGTTYEHTLAANNAYNFKVNVAVGQLIEFTVTKQPTWEDGDGDDDTTLTL